MRINEAGQDGMTVAGQQVGVARNIRSEVGRSANCHDPLTGYGHGFGGRAVGVLGENPAPMYYKVGRAGGHGV